LVEIVRVRGDIGRVGKHDAELRQPPAGLRRAEAASATQAGVGSFRPAGEAMDGGFEEPVGEVVLGEFVGGDIEPVASPAVGATGLGGDEPAACQDVDRSSMVTWPRRISR
jgi:hypothetical protein